MPQGAAQLYPSGLWSLKPKPASLPYLVGGTFIKFLIPIAVLAGFNYLRTITYNYTYTSFIGKSLSVGHMSNLTHEPASVEEIDRLKEEQAERRRIARAQRARSTKQ